MNQYFKRTGDLFSFLKQLWYFKRHQMCLIKDIHKERGIKNSIRLFSFTVLYFFGVNNIMSLYIDSSCSSSCSSSSSSSCSCYAGWVNFPSGSPALSPWSENSTAWYWTCPAKLTRCFSHSSLQSVPSDLFKGILGNIFNLCFSQTIPVSHSAES